MNEHIIRMRHEASELGIKIEKLLEFTNTPTYKTLSLERQMLLIKQLTHMDGYYTILKERIGVEIIEAHK